MKLFKSKTEIIPQTTKTVVQEIHETFNTEVETLLVKLAEEDYL